MVNVYYYIYYKLYRLLESNSLPWWSDFKAGFLIAGAEGLLIALVDFKLHKLFEVGGATELGKWGYILIIGAPPLALNYFLFGYRDRWKEIISYFDKADSQLKKKMNVQMIVTLLFTVIAFIILFSL